MPPRTKVLGREALNKRLRQLAPEAEKQAEVAKLEIAQDLATAVKARAPHGASDDYADSIQAGYLRNNPNVKDLAGIRLSKDPDAAGIFARFIWRFLEFGTAPHINAGKFAGTKHPGTAAQPHIFPTWRAMRRKAKRKIAGAINKAVRKVRKK